MRQAKLAAAFVLVGLLVVFTLQNHEVVQLRFLFWKVEMSRAVMVLGVLATGLVLGWTLSEITGKPPKR